MVRLFQPLLHIPLLKHRMRRIYEKNLPAMQQIDDGVAYLHSQPRAFFLSLLWEYVARVVNALVEVALPDTHSYSSIPF